jgi:hypothetical protein
MKYQSVINVKLASSCMLNYSRPSVHLIMPPQQGTLVTSGLAPLAYTSARSFLLQINIARAQGAAEIFLN